MRNIVKMLLALLGMAAALIYTVYNYSTGRIDMTFLLVCVAILGFPFVNIVNLLIQELKNK